MPKSRIPSPARSQGLVTPRRNKPRRTRSVGSPANSIASGRLTSVIEQFKDKNMESFALSPLSSRKSLLTDNTDIEEPRRRSWWKKLGENSRDVMEVLEDNEAGVANNAIEEIMDIEVLSQEKKNYTLDLPESSDSESINSIVLPQRRLFTQKENHAQKKFGQLVGKRESSTKSQKSDTGNELTLHAGTKELFGHNRNRPIFPAELLNISPNKTAADKTKELAAEPKVQVRNIFGNRPGSKRKNMFAEFVVSESEDEIPDIQPKVFGFPKKPDQRRGSSTSRSVRGPSPSSSITTDIELDDWKHLPSSTMVENQIEDMMVQTPVKKAKLSKLSEIKESETGTNLTDKTNQSDKSTRNKSKQLDNVEENQKNVINTSKSVNVSQQSNRTRKSGNKSKISPNKELLQTKATEKYNDEIITPVDQVDNIVPVQSQENDEPDDDDSPGSDDFHLHYETEEKAPLNASTNQQSGKYNERKILDDIVANTDIQTTHDNKTVIEAAIERSSNIKNQINESIVSTVSNIEGTKKVEEIIPLNQDTSVDNIQKPNNGTITHKHVTIESETNSEQNASSNEITTNLSNTTKNELNQSENQIRNNKYGEHEMEDVQNKSRKEVNPNDVQENNQEIEQEHVEEEVVEGNEETDESNKEIEESAEEIEQEIDNEDEQVSDREELIEESDQEDTNEEPAESDEEVEQEDEKANDSQEIDNEEMNEDNNIEEVENEEDEIENNSEQISNHNEVDSDDNAVASDDEAGQDDEVEEMEEDDKMEDNEENELTEENDNTNAQSNEEIEDTPNTTHDTTGRNRKKNSTEKSPEVILHDKTNQNDSFTPQGRNTSVRHTKTMYKSMNIRPSMAPPRESTGMSDGTKNSSAEGSGWDSHRTTRKTLRQTFGKDFTMRKSLRALVMEKSAKQRQTEHMDLQSETVKFPQANSTELPDESNRDVMEVEETLEESDHEVSRRTRQTTLETYLQKIKQDNLEKKLKMEEEVRNSLKAPSRDVLNFFKVPTNPVRRMKPLHTKSKKPIKSSIPICDLPSEVIEDMKYKPPKRFQPTNASWITKRLYKFLETKLEPKYDYKARVRAEKLVQTLYHYVKDLRRVTVAGVDATDNLKHEMARLDIVKTHFEFYEFFHEFMPREVRIKVVPDIVNKIALPKHGVFSDILRGNTVQG